MSDYTYLGSELDLFAKVLNWKSYWRSQLRVFVSGTVVEVGAGIGNNTRALEDLDCEKWVCIEPDPGLCAQISANTAVGRRTQVIAGTLADLPDDPPVDTILYLDVLEHIEDDATELRLAARHLRPGGHLIVLAPAYQSLYSPFDRAVGHFRRYCRRSLCAAAPAELSLVLVRYLDSVGLIASLGNRLLLRHALPTAEQLRVWDECLVPMSRYIDPALGYRLGKSILGVWRQTTRDAVER
jgi:SAM-dependent methyltransferase